MGWRATTGVEQDVLNSIVALLLGLADLAERAAGRSPWVRWRVLWAAWQADLIARGYVAGSAWNEAGRHWSPALPMVRHGTDPADAMDMAASLRALALIVSHKAAQLRRLAFPQREQASDECAYDSRPHHDLLKRLLAAAVSPVELRDTS